MADQYTLISTWTRFRVPLEENIFDIDDGSDCGKKWIEIVRPLVKAPGHMESHWGRLVEDPAQVMLVSSKPCLYGRTFSLHAGGLMLSYSQSGRTARY